jgi:hypothetical protein
MLLIREVFTAKPGQASKLAKLFKKSMGKATGSRVMTDLTGDYNTVVMEMQVKDLAEWDKMMADYRSGKMASDMDAKTSEVMSHYTDMYLTGRREIFQILD